MNDRDNYLKQISDHGDRYGGRGGLLDLLTWCNKTGLMQVTTEEARLFLENPDAPYPGNINKSGKDSEH